MSSRARTQYPFYPTKYGYGDPEPDHVIVREVDFRVFGSEVKIFFSRGKDFSLLAAHETIGSVIRKLRNNTFEYFANPPTMKQEYEIPLSLHNREPSYIVYRLSDKNWQFWRKGEPITIGSDGRNAYYDATKYGDQGASNQGSPGQPAIDKCKVASMIGVGSTRRYTHGINLHVELIFENHLEEKSFMPLIVDPDIRYPGGSVAEGP